MYFIGKYNWLLSALETGWKGRLADVFTWFVANTHNFFLFLTTHILFLPCNLHPTCCKSKQLYLVLKKVIVILWMLIVKKNPEINGHTLRFFGYSVSTLKRRLQFIWVPVIWTIISWLQEVLSYILFFIKRLMKVVRF